MFKFTVNAEGTPLGATYVAPDNFIQEVREGSKDRAFDMMKFLVGLQDSFRDLIPLDLNNLDKKYYKIEDGHKFIINFQEKDLAMSEINQDLLLRKEYEPETTKLIKNVVQLGDTVVDVGASIGHFTLLLARQVGATGKVFAIEPTKNQFPYLLENIKNNGYTNVEALNIGASDKNELSTFQVNAGARAEQLEGRVLDEILPEKVDFIKIDVDGSEPKVLRGLLKTFERNPQLKMVIEYYPKYQIQLGNDPKDMIDILDKYFNYEKIPGDYTDTYWNYYCQRK